MSCSVIITASHIPSHPSIDFIKMTYESLRYANLEKGTPIILAHDFNDSESYKQYLANLEKYIKDKPDVRIVTCEKHKHLTGNVRNAFNHINTDYVLIIQHDLPFIREFNIPQIIEDMQLNPELKHVRFNKRSNTKTGFDSINNLFGKQLISKTHTYTRTPGWSDNNHLCPTAYYRDVILKECSDGAPMESFIWNKSINEDTHAKYGTYLFGPINEKAYITHIDGRNNKSIKL